MATNGKSSKRERRHNIGRVALAVVHKFGHANVTRVIDADEDLAVEVTEKDQRNSRKKDHADCAMAVAVRRQESTATKPVKAIIARSIAYVIKGNTAVRYEVPNSVSREVVAFDRGAEFEVGNYKLKAPSWRLGQMKQDDSGSSRNPNASPAHSRFVHTTVNVRDDLKRKVITAGE